MKETIKLIDWAQVFILFSLLLLVGLQMSNVVEYGETRTLFRSLLFVNIVLWVIKIMTLKQDKQSDKKLSPAIIKSLTWLNIILTIIVLVVLFMNV